MTPPPWQNEPAIVMIREYYRDIGKRPDIIALPGMIGFARWMIQKSEQSSDTPPPSDARAQHN